MISSIAAVQIPTDAGSILAYVLLAGFVVLIWYGNRMSDNDTDAGGEEAEESRTTDSASSRS